MSFPDRVASRAQTISPIKVILTLLALPFYLLGLVAGLVLVTVSWAWAAATVGVEDVRRRGGAPDAR